MASELFGGDILQTNDEAINQTIAYYEECWALPPPYVDKEYFTRVSYGRYFINSVLETLINDPFADPMETLWSQAFYCFGFGKNDILSDAVEQIAQDLQFIYDGGSM